MLIAAAVLTGLLALATVLPLLPIAHGIVRMGGFPRVQVLAVAVLTLAGALVWGGLADGWSWIEAVLVVICLLQLYQIVQFTPLWRRQSSPPAPGAAGEPLRIVACNVKMSNDRFDHLCDTIAAADPDIAIFMEVDERWREGLEPFLSRYRHVVARPQDNSYGLVLASRFALSDTRVRCLLTDGVPSIVTLVTLPEGGRFRLYCIHPEPPVPGHGTVGRDGETALAALWVRGEPDMPAIVAGDLNDVAWSLTTDRFRRVSGLLDPRIGRSVFSTFDARYPLVRWPLDHLFHSADFRFKAMRRLPFVGSDHFPVAFDLLLCSNGEAIARPRAPRPSDLRRAEALMREAERRKEKPIGTDWEK